MKLTSILATAVALVPSFTLATNHFVGIAVSNSIGNTGTYTCRTQAQWNTLASDLKAYGFSVIRITGFDCNALDMASSAAAGLGMWVMAGIYVNSGTIAASMTQINNDVQTFRAAVAKYGAGRYTRLAIGNEVNDSASNIMAKVYDVRGYLNSIGINVAVSTVHTWVFIRDNPAMCGADYVGANAHAFYDPNTTSGNAGAFITNTVLPALNSACPGKTILITESGWPSRGGAACSGCQGTPALAHENAALKSLNCAAQNVKMYAFEYDDQLWKSNDAERSFGMYAKSLTVADIITSC